MLHGQPLYTNEITVKNLQHKEFLPEILPNKCPKNYWAENSTSSISGNSEVRFSHSYHRMGSGMVS